MRDGVFERTSPIFPYGSDYRFHLSMFPYWKVMPVLESEKRFGVRDQGAGL